MPADSAHAMVQQNVGRPRRARAAVSADHAIGGERDLHFRRFEPFVEEFGRALGEDLDQRDDVLGRQMADAPGEAQIVHDVDGGRRKLRRCSEQQAFDDPRDALKLILVCGVDLRVVFGELGDFREGLRPVLPHEEVPAIGKDGKEGGILGIHAIAELFELQLADDALLHQAGQVCSGRDTIARPDLFGHGTPAQEFATFEHEHLPSRTRQVGGGDQAVVAAADDDHIVFGHALSLSSLYRLRNATTASGGRVTAMLCLRLCLGIGREDTMPPLPILDPPNSSESVLRISS